MASSLRSDRLDESEKSQPPAREPRNFAYKEIWGVVDRNDRGFWTRIGTAFENRDGSWNLKFDYMPAHGDTSIQLRDAREKEAEA